MEHLRPQRAYRHNPRGLVNRSRFTLKGWREALSSRSAWISRESLLGGDDSPGGDPCSAILDGAPVFELILNNELHNVYFFAHKEVTFSVDEGGQSRYTSGTRVSRIHLSRGESFHARRFRI